MTDQSVAVTNQDRKEANKQTEFPLNVCFLLFLPSS